MTMRSARGGEGGAERREKDGSAGAVVVKDESRQSKGGRQSGGTHLHCLLQVVVDGWKRIWGDERHTLSK